VLIGQTILVPGVAAPGVYYAGAWMPRQGNSFLMVIQIMKASAGSGWGVKINVQTKNAEEADPAISAAGLTTLSMTTATTERQLVVGCKELVRLVYNATTNGGPAQWLHLRANPPIWLPN
jgi:hypothetical protein